MDFCALWEIDCSVKESAAPGGSQPSCSAHRQPAPPGAGV